MIIYGMEPQVKKDEAKEQSLRNIVGKINGGCKLIERYEFDLLNPQDKLNFHYSGGKIIGMNAEL